MSWRVKPPPPVVREAPPELVGLVEDYLKSNGEVPWLPRAYVSLRRWLKGKKGTRFVCGSVSVRLYQDDLRVVVLPVPKFR